MAGKRKSFLFSGRGIPALLLLLFAFLLPAFSGAEGNIILSLPKEVQCYTHSEITVDAPAAGEAELRLYDSLENPWLIRRESLSAGITRLPWDGLGANGEKLMSGPYRMEILLKGEDGREYAASASFQVKGFAKALLLALPSSEKLYLDGGESWFVECCVPSECIVAMEVLDREGKAVYTHSVLMGDPDRDVIRWNGVGNDRKKVAPGEYSVRIYPKLNPDFDHVYPLTVEETSPEPLPLSVTGSVIPERGMTDAEIWEIMMRPSVVINEKGSSLRFKLLESPSRRSPSAGTVCCATQGLEVLALENGWARIRAWNYDNAEEITGWFPANQLTVITPAPHYGVLVDKRAQTLTVYRDGTPVGTVSVSTGLPTARKPQRETPPGAFLTDIHFSPSFAQDGLRYDYPLRYQGGNIIHSTGFVRIPHTSWSVKDYSKNLPLLGSKASHGCVRVSPFADADCPINSYWLWTHLPYHTRVIILPE